MRRRFVFVFFHKLRQTVIVGNFVIERCALAFLQLDRAASGEQIHVPEILALGAGLHHDSFANYFRLDGHIPLMPANHDVDAADFRGQRFCFWQANMRQGSKEVALVRQYL